MFNLISGFNKQPAAAAATPSRKRPARQQLPAAQQQSINHQCHWAVGRRVLLVSLLARATRMKNVSSCLSSPGSAQRQDEPARPWPAQYRADCSRSQHKACALGRRFVWFQSGRWFQFCVRRSKASLEWREPRARQPQGEPLRQVSTDGSFPDLHPSRSGSAADSAPGGPAPPAPADRWHLRAASRLPGSGPAERAKKSEQSVRGSIRRHYFHMQPAPICDRRFGRSLRPPVGLFNFEDTRSACFGRRSNRPLVVLGRS